MSIKYFDVLEKLPSNIVPFGLGNNYFPKTWLSDKNGDNISDLNQFFGEATGMYWIWKNYLNNIKTNWIGFCQYRKFFVKENLKDNNLSFDIFKQSLIREIENEYNKYDCILGTKFSVSNYKISKIIKNHLLVFLKDPKIIFSKKKKKFKITF